MKEACLVAIKPVKESIYDRMNKLKKQTVENRAKEIRRLMIIYKRPLSEVLLIDYIGFPVFYTNQGGKMEVKDKFKVDFMREEIPATQRKTGLWYRRESVKG